MPSDLTNWPEFDVPAEALREGATRSDSPAAPVVATPATPAVPPPAAATPPAAVTPPVVPTPAPAAAPPAAPPAVPPGFVPMYRLNEEVATRDRHRAEAERIATENRTLQQEIARLRAAPPAAPPPPAAAAPPVDPEAQARDEAARTRVLALFPELAHLKDLAELARSRGDISAAVQAVGAYRQAETAFYDQHTDRQFATLYGEATKVLLGADKTVADLPEMAKAGLRSAFATWVHDDPARAARYDALDDKLVGEFWPIYKAAMFDPVQRTAGVAALTQLESRPGLPVGGSIAAPTTPAPSQPPVVADEDAIYARAWEGHQRISAGG